MREISYQSNISDLTNQNLSFHIESVWNTSECSDHEADRKIDELKSQFEIEFTDEKVQETFDNLYSLVIGFDMLSTENKGFLLQTMINIHLKLVSEVSQMQSTSSKNIFKAFTYFFQKLVKICEERFEKTVGNTVSTLTLDDKGKVKGSKNSKTVSSTKSSDFNWIAWRPSALKLFNHSLDSMIDTMNIVSETFLVGFWEYAIYILEKRPLGTGTHSTADIILRSICVEIITKSTQLFGSSSTSGSFVALATALTQSLTTSEYMAPHIAEICQKSNRLLVREILTEISDPKIAKMASAKNVGAFIEIVAKEIPDLIITHLPVIHNQIDSPAHQIRSSVVTAMGHIVSHIHTLSCLQTEGPGTNLPTLQIQQSESPRNSNSGELNDSQIDVDSSRRLSEDSKIDEVHPTNLAQIIRVRDSILNILIERTHDKSYYTRATVLKSWANLLEQNAIPLRHFSTVCDIAVDRLQDKTTIVRKNAIALLTSLIDNNPFGLTLTASHYAAMKESVEKQLIDRLDVLRTLVYPETGEDEIDDVANEGEQKIVALSMIIEGEEDEDEDQIASTVEEAKKFKAQMHIDRENKFLLSDEVVADPEVVNLKTKRDYATDACRFIHCITKALSCAEDMFMSKSTSDIVESLEFVTRAVKFNVDGASLCMRRSFTLVWHQDVLIKTQCLTSFSSVYLTDGSVLGEPRPLAAADVALNLIKLTQHCEENEYASLEQIISELFQLEKFHLLRDQVLSDLWESVSDEAHTHTFGNFTSTLTSPNPSTSCTTLGAILYTIATISKLTPTATTPCRLATLVKLALDDRVFGNPDMSALRGAMQCLLTGPSACQVFRVNQNDSTTDGTHKFTDLSLYQEVYNSTTSALMTTILGTFCADNEDITSRWFCVCEVAVHALFHVHPSPDAIMGGVISYSYQLLSQSTSKSNTAKLARVIFLLGQSALNVLVYTEKIAALAKKALECQHNAALNAADDRGTVNDNKIKNNSKESEEADAMETEMGLVASADADHELRCNDIIEHKLVLENILGRFHALVAYVAANENQTFNNPLLREASLLALCRYMSVSAALCEKYLPILVTALDREAAPGVRTTIMIGLGDMAFRFPNLLEPWTGHLYARLEDSSDHVRYNALTVLTHLILNDMIKVKGQVSHVVLCLNDSNSRIRDLAAMFFTKLSERSNNPVYNLLGDIIATLSADKEDDTHCSSSSLKAAHIEDYHKELVHVATVNVGSIPAKRLSKADFQTTMQFMLSFVHKDIQANSLLERLLLRLSMAQSLQQRRKLAFCIGQLKINEKGVKRIVELFKQIRDALYDDEVRDFICAAVKLAKRVGRVNTNASSVESKTGDVLQDVEGEILVYESAIEGSSSPRGVAITLSADARNIIAEFDNMIENLKNCAEGNASLDDDEVSANPNEGHSQTSAEPTQDTKKCDLVGKKKVKVKQVKKIRRPSSDDDNDDNTDVGDEAIDDEDNDPNNSENRINYHASKTVVSQVTQKKMNKHKLANSRPQLEIVGDKRRLKRNALSSRSNDD